MSLDIPANPLTPGKVTGPISSIDAYLSDNGVERGDPAKVMSRSSLMEFNRCPLRWINGYREADTDATEWGSLIDCLLFTPGQFKFRYAVAPPFYIDAKTKEEKPWNWNANVCKQWKAEQGSLAILKATQWHAAQDAVNVLLRNNDVLHIVKNSQKQVLCTASYKDADTGIEVPLQGLIDAVPALNSKYPKSLVDLKTTTSAAMRPWTRAVHDWGLDAQAALYLDIWTVNTKEDRLDFRHIVQESFSPYHVELRLLSETFIEIGRWRYLQALKRYCQCLKTGIWPGYEGGIDIFGWTRTEPEQWMVE